MQISSNSEMINSVFVVLKVSLFMKRTWQRCES